LAEKGLVLGTAGNISARADQHVAVTPTGAVLESLTPDLGVYRRYGAGAVVHTHAPLATALSCVLDELPVVHYHQLMLGGPTRVAPYRTFGTPELAEVTLSALQDRAAALMANHGAIVHAHDLETAVDLSLLLEWACGVYWHAAAIGSPRTIDADQWDAVVESIGERGYGGY
jgi:L-fuculose-phosphate aldolase